MVIRFLYLPVFVFLFALAACGPATLEPTATAIPTPTPISTATATPVAGEAFLEAVDEWIKADDSLPPAGREAVVALHGMRPTFVFPENQGLVLQFNVVGVPEERQIKKTAVLLMGTGVIKAQDYGVPLAGIEVVFYAAEDRPWLALASVPPWGADELRLAPLAPEYIERLLKAGVITPTPAPTY
jgi:hypothetical protein